MRLLCPNLTDEGKDLIEKDLRFSSSVRLGHKSLRTLMKRSSSWYLPGTFSYLSVENVAARQIRTKNCLDDLFINVPIF